MGYTISLLLGQFWDTSQIDHTYLSIEAQCVSHHYPRWTATNVPRVLSMHVNGVYVTISAPFQKQQSIHFYTYLSVDMTTAEAIKDLSA